jgi:flavin-dependent dehydrogenase
MMLIGDAGGIANPLNGEGIGPAMFSGHAATTALLEAWRGRSPLRNELLGYEDAVRRRYGKTFEAAERR